MTIQIKTLNHVGVTVTSLARTLEFYRRVFGKEPVVRGTGSGPALARVVGLDDAKIDYAFLDLGNTRMEILEYVEPEGRREFELRACDTGAVHICFDVEDVHAAYAEMKELGVEFLSEPIVLDDTHGLLSGLTYVYFRDPDGVLLQLYRLPDGSSLNR